MTEIDVFAKGEEAEAHKAVLRNAPPAPEFGEATSAIDPSPPPPAVDPPSVEIPTPDPNIYSLSERKKMEDQDTAAIIFSIMDSVDRRIVQFFSRPFLKEQILINNGLNGPKLAIYFNEPQERVATRIRMLADIGAIFFDENGTPIANEKIVQFISAVAPTY